MSDTPNVQKSIFSQIKNKSHRQVKMHMKNASLQSYKGIDKEWFKLSRNRIINKFCRYNHINKRTN